MVILETSRLRLRQMTLADAPSLRALSVNPNVYRYTGDGPLADDAAAITILETRIFPQYREHGVGRWAVERAHDGTFLGWCGLRFDAEQQRYDLGYRLFEEHWGQGYATEAAQACVAWFRARFPGMRMVGRARVENAASIRVLENVGLTPEGFEDDCDGRVVVYGDAS